MFNFLRSSANSPQTEPPAPQREPSLFESFNAIADKIKQRQEEEAREQEILADRKVIEAKKIAQLLPELERFCMDYNGVLRSKRVKGYSLSVVEPKEEEGSDSERFSIDVAREDGFSFSFYVSEGVAKPYFVNVERGGRYYDDHTHRTRWYDSTHAATAEEMLKKFAQLLDFVS